MSRARLIRIGFVAAVAALLALGACKKDTPPDPAALARSAALSAVQNLPSDSSSARKLRVTRFDLLDDFPKPKRTKDSLWEVWEMATGTWAIPAPEADVKRAGDDYEVTVRFRYRGEDAEGSVYRRGEAVVRAQQQKSGKWITTLLSLRPVGSVEFLTAAGRWSLSVGVGTLMLFLAFSTLGMVIPGKIEGCGEALSWLLMASFWGLCFTIPLFIGAFAGTARGSYNAFGGLVPAIAGVLVMLVLARVVWVIGEKSSKTDSSGRDSPSGPPSLLGESRNPVPEDLKEPLLAELRQRIGEGKYRDLVDRVGEDRLAQLAWDELAKRR